MIRVLVRIYYLERKTDGPANIGICRKCEKS